MKLAAFSMIVLAVGLGACDSGQDERKMARLERELNQMRAQQTTLEQLVSLQDRTGMLDQASVDAKLRQALAILDENAGQRGRTPEELEARDKRLRELLQSLQGEESADKAE